MPKIKPLFPDYHAHHRAIQKYGSMTGRCWICAKQVKGSARKIRVSEDGFWEVSVDHPGAIEAQIGFDCDKK